MNDIYFDIASDLQYNAKQEAQAVLDYTNLLDKINSSKIDESTRNILIDNISELISDELNHQAVLNKLFVNLTNIEPNKT